MNSLTHTRTRMEENEDSHFLDELHAIKKQIDPSLIDLSDPRTNYIISK